MKEEDRLAAMVVRIDDEVAVVPRGAYIRTPLNEVIPNKMFQGGCVCHYSLAHLVNSKIIITEL